MSFTSDVKGEICLDALDIYEAKAQLCALMQVKATLHMNWQGMYVAFQMENAGIIKHIYGQAVVPRRGTTVGAQKDAVEKKQHLPTANL